MSRSYANEIAKLSDLETFDAAAFLAGERSHQDCCDFIVALALVFNDLKDLLLGDHLLMGEVPKDPVKPTREAGAFAGSHLHFFRLILGLLCELLYLVKKNDSVRKSAQFNAVVKKLPKQMRSAWEKLVAASEVATSADPDVRFLVIARNTVAYHYDRKAIGQGYRRAFENSSQQPFLSHGGSLSTTRFYFAERAAQAYLQELFGESDLEKYFLKQPQLLSDVAMALFGIVTRFVNSRGFGWRDAGV